jgi:hypothetical protein
MGLETAMFGLGMVRKHAAREEMDNLESWLVGLSLRFAAEITQAYKEVPPILAATEGLSLMLHALRRETYRADEYKAWDGIFEPSMKQMYQLFAMTLSAWSGTDFDRGAVARDAETLISSRSLEYQTLPFLTGAPDDRQSVVYAASRRIGDTVEPAKRDEAIAAAHKILTRFIEVELPDQAAKLEKALYGRRAA